MAHGPYLACPVCNSSTRHRPYLSGLNVAAAPPPMRAVGGRRHANRRTLPLSAC
jgi:hypothetical protein